MRSLRRVGALAGVVALSLGAVACSSDDRDAGSSALAREVIEHYADGVYASYALSLTEAQAMDEEIDAFLAAPSEEGLELAREAWLAARPAYGRTEAFRFYGGPIDDEETGPEGQINAWPLDEAYIDYVVGDPGAGIINNASTYPEITVEVLTDANEAGGEANISTGWHAIEFLLWGQDLSTTGPGARPYTDYTTAPNADRRGEYLAVVTDLLIDDLQSLVDAWAPGVDDNYAAEFLALDDDEALSYIFTGIGELSRGELAGERMNVAYEERSQENEHSCFSDNTLADIQANAEGIQMVWTGVYVGGPTGPGLAALVAETDEDLAAETTEVIAASIEAAESIPAPFDQHLAEDADDTSPGRVAIVATMDSLSNQTDLIVQSADALGISIAVS